MDAVDSGKTTSILKVPISPFQFFFAVGFLVSFMFLLIQTSSFADQEKVIRATVRLKRMTACLGVLLRGDRHLWALIKEREQWIVRRLVMGIVLMLVLMFVRVPLAISFLFAD